MENDHILHKWIDDELTAEELALFKLRPEYDALVALYKNTDHLSTPPLAEEQMLKEILSQEKTTESNTPARPKGRRVFMNNFLKYAVAAMVLLTGGWFLFKTISQPVSSYQVAKGETVRGSLPDESSFVLNAESELSYDADSWENNRRLNLRGEAFFQVKKGSKFSVLTKDGIVEVLGTEFNVNARNGFFEVFCQSGKVQVKSADGITVGELTKDERIRINPDQTTEKWKSPAIGKPSWMSGLSKFRKVPLSMVLAEIERQYDVEILANGIDQEAIISCNFQHDDLLVALKTTIGMLNVKYEISGKKVLLTRE